MELNLAQRGKLGPAGASQVILRLAGIDRIWEELRRAGAEVCVEIADRVYGVRDVSIRDASGNRLDLGEPLESVRAPRPAASDVKVFVPAKQPPGLGRTLHDARARGRRRGPGAARAGRDRERRLPRCLQVEGPREESWGLRTTYVWDPSGVLLHFAERLPPVM